MRRPLALCAALAALVATGCGGGGSDAPGRDRVVAEGVEGSGERALLRSHGFRSAIEAIGVRPRSSGLELGHDLGHAMRSILTDSGSLDPGAYAQPYRGLLENLGRLSQAAFVRRWGRGPEEMARRLGVVAGLLEVRLNEGRKPALMRSLVPSFGIGGPIEGRPKPANAAAHVAARCRALLRGKARAAFARAFTRITAR